MKTLVKTIGIFLLAGMLLSLPARAENKDSLKTYELTPKGDFDFNKLVIKGVVDVELIKGKECRFWIEYQEDEINNPAKVLNLDYDPGIKEAYLKHSNKQDKPDQVYIQYKELRSIKAKTAIDIQSKDTITGGQLELSLSGASSTDNLPVKVKELKIDASGASSVNLTGWAKNQTINASGASDIKAQKLRSKNLNVEASGASDVDVYVSDSLKGKISGASSLENEVEAKKVNLNHQGAAGYSRNVDTTQFEFGKSKVTITNKADGEDVEININEKEDDIEDTEKEDEEFDGHWSGFELGYNGYLLPGYKMNIPDGYKFLDLKDEKSLTVNLNIAEFNLLTLGSHVGLYTGLGLQYNNYRFSNNTIIDTDSSGITGPRDKNPDKNYIKSKLVINYLTAPLILEYTTQGEHEFHIGAGAQFSWKIGKHSKIVYEKNNDRRKRKDYSNFYLNPYKIQLTGRIGYNNWITFFATYSINPMFEDGKGPEIYPFTAGIKL